jgi:ubiquinone biosynthesis protein Coq4
MMADARSVFADRIRSGLGPETPDPSAASSPERLEAAEVGHIAFAAPWKLAQVMDRFADRRGFAVLGPDAVGSWGTGRVPLAVPEALFTALWSIVDGAGGGRSALEFTQATAALGTHLDPGFRDAQLEVSRNWPGVADAAAQGWPEPFTLNQLTSAPAGSLASEFRTLIVDNGFDLEVLDRDTLSLRDLPAPLNYLNARILQVHDLWHLVGGYQTTGLHEIAISAFQLAQFGHAYSAWVLAVTLTSASVEPVRYGVLSGFIAAAWSHGRATPPLLGVDWPSVWAEPIGTVRQRLGVTAFESPWPADLFERAA